MVEKDLAVGEIGSSRMLVASPRVSASSMSSPKSFRIFGFGRGDFWSLRVSKAVILDWMDVEGDMINYVSAQSCPPRLLKSSTPSQVIRVKCTSKPLLMRLADFCLLPIGTGPDPSVRRPETIRELI
jgi:hypothetical protein